MSKKKILITGGTGFIGYHLSKRCLKLNWEVYSLSTKKPPKYRKLSYVKYIMCDITNKNFLKKKVNNKFDFVVNLAGYVDHSNKKQTFKSHYIGCKNLAALFLNSPIKKFVQIGSSVEYGKTKSPQKENRFNKQKTYSIYASSKLLSTKLLLKLYKKFKFPVIIARLYLVYGPNQEANRVVPTTILNALNNKKFNCSDGTQFRDFTHINDVIDAIIKILLKKNLNGEIINIGQGKSVKIKNVINNICKFVGKGEPLFGKIKLRKDEIINLYPSINKAFRLLNWQPKINLEDGLKKTISFYKKNGTKNFSNS